VTAILLVVGLTLLVSIPFAIADDLGVRAEERAQNVANGTVISVEMGAGERLMATVEFKPRPGEAVRFQALADGRAGEERTLTKGDRVLVAYDTANPERARVWSIRRQWTGIVRRSIGGFGCLAAALAVSLGSYLRSRALANRANRRAL
jgi:uncharacterized protein DUF3592